MLPIFIKRQRVISKRLTTLFLKQLQDYWLATELASFSIALSLKGAGA